MSILKKMNAYNFEESKISPYITEIFPKNISLNKKIQFFSSLPYTEHPFSKRNWGHNLHTLCSYQSKLKASMAYYLVQTFSLQKQKDNKCFSITEGSLKVYMVKVKVLSLPSSLPTRSLPP